MTDVTLTWEEYKTYPLPKGMKSIMSSDGKARTIHYDDTTQIMATADENGVTLRQIKP